MMYVAGGKYFESTTVASMYTNEFVSFNLTFL